MSQDEASPKTTAEVAATPETQASPAVAKAGGLSEKVAQVRATSDSAAPAVLGSQKNFLLGIIIIVLVAGGFYFLGQASKNPGVKSETETVLPSPESTLTPATVTSSNETKASLSYGSLRELPTVAIVSWSGRQLYTPSFPFIDPLKTDDAEYFDSMTASMAYYELATLSNGDTLVRGDLERYFKSTGSKSTARRLFTVSPEGEVHLLVDYFLLMDDFNEVGLEARVEPVRQTVTGFGGAKTLSYQGETFALSESQIGTLDLLELKELLNGRQLTELFTSTEGTFYRALGTEGLILTRAFYLEAPDGLMYYYYPESTQIRYDDGSLKIAWEDGRDARAVYTAVIYGCGVSATSAQTIINPALNIENELARVGRLLTNGEPVYSLSPAASVVKELYDDYERSWNSFGNSQVLSLAEYGEAPTHFVYQDALGDYVLLINSDYGELAECGKPVIYLYPEEETVVDVAVGAQVSLAEPAYSATGWQGVLARPNGELTYQGETYRSLFWEGLGNGVYPNLSNQGVVVSQAELLPTVEKQLTQLGLTAAERADFLEFWAEHLPKTPYVRLTWLGTKEMETLAPLTITPRPQTLIRVFLESEGLSAPVTLKPQELKVVARRGFTVVEWGGLLN